MLTFQQMAWRANGEWCQSSLQATLSTNMTVKSSFITNPNPMFARHCARSQGGGWVHRGVNTTESLSLWSVCVCVYMRVSRPPLFSNMVARSHCGCQVLEMWSFFWGVVAKKLGFYFLPALSLIVPANLQGRNSEQLSMVHPLFVG